MMEVFQKHGRMCNENGFHVPQTPASVGPTKQSSFSFRKRFERIDWKRLGKFCLQLSIDCTCV